MPCEQGEGAQAIGVLLPSAAGAPPLTQTGAMVMGASGW